MVLRDGFNQGEPCWVDLSTEDVGTAQAFYGGLFGWTWEDLSPAPEMAYFMAQKDGRKVAGLHSAPRSVWYTYLAVDSADEAFGRAIEAGATALEEPFDIMTSGRMAFIADNQGVAVGLWEAREHIGAGLIKEPGTLSWSELYVPDVDAAVEFLGAVVGMTAEPAGMGPMSYTLLKAGEEVVAGVMTPPENVPPCWAVYFATDDINDTATRLVELGGQVINGPFPTPLGQMIVAGDTTGAVFLVNDGKPVEGSG